MSWNSSIASAFKAITSSLTASGSSAGNAATAAASAVHSLFGGTSSTVKPLLTTIMNSPGIPGVVEDCVAKILETQGLAPGVIAMVNSLPQEAAAAAVNPANMIQLVTAIGAIEEQL